MNVTHKPGKKHTNADTLSRYVNTIVIPLLSRQEIAREQKNSIGYTISVSYTHLDVYKRQVLRFSEQLIWCCHFR